MCRLLEYKSLVASEDGILYLYAVLATNLDDLLFRAKEIRKANDKIGFQQ
jgi:hypothetical protein